MDSARLKKVAFAGCCIGCVEEGVNTNSVICVGICFRELRKCLWEMEARLLDEDLSLLDAAVGVGG